MENEKPPLRSPQSTASPPHDDASPIPLSPARPPYHPTSSQSPSHPLPRRPSNPNINASGSLGLSILAAPSGHQTLNASSPMDLNRSPIDLNRSPRPSGGVSGTPSNPLGFSVPRRSRTSTPPTTPSTIVSKPLPSPMAFNEDEKDRFMFLLEAATEEAEVAAALRDRLAKRAGPISPGSHAVDPRKRKSFSQRDQEGVSQSTPTSPAGVISPATGGDGRGGAGTPKGASGTRPPRKAGTVIPSPAGADGLRMSPEGGSEAVAVPRPRPRSHSFSAGSHFHPYKRSSIDADGLDADDTVSPKEAGNAVEREPSAAQQEALHMQALAALEASLGQLHPDVGKANLHMAYFLYARQQRAKAEACVLKSWTVFKHNVARLPLDRQIECFRSYLTILEDMNCSEKVPIIQKEMEELIPPDTPTPVALLPLEPLPLQT
eukprot:jgi/Mesvir1/10117/Mv16835-RA.1